MKPRVLCIDDDQDQCDLIGVALSRLGFEATTITSPARALDLAVKEPFDVVLTDLGMAEMDGLALCERMAGARPGIPIVVLTGMGSMEAAIGAMRAGAYDFLTKPVEPKLLGIAVARAARHGQLTAEVARLREALSEAPAPSPIIGGSPAMARVNDLIARLGASETSVLIVGETGTGKELVARAVHAASPRTSGPFVALNCAAIPPQLLESELFGHARGAFTDAKTARHGLFLEASGGTLFLDEIGEMVLEVQAKLLRALQERKVRPVGASAEVPFDARIVTATHRDLEVEVRERRFRQDLFYRIHVVRIDVPPLRRRGSDVLELASFFLQRATSKRAGPRLELSPQVAERLLAYDWPGNVRELENCIERAVALARFEQLTVDDLPEKIRQYRPDRFTMSADDAAEIVSLEELERRYITRVIKLLGGNKARAAQLLGLDRRTLYRKLEKYEATDRDRGLSLPRAASEGN
jgi:DNA-binding NtrC family response regulator